MPAPERNRWVEFWAVAKERRDVARTNVAEWYAACKEEPSLIWQTPSVRYATYLIAAIILVVFLRGFIDFIQPVPRGQMTPQATTAYFDVICSNPACGRHFVIERQFKFNDFPVTCPHCNQQTGLRAMRCYSDQCRGRLVKTIEVDGQLKCLICGQPIAPPP